MVEGLEERVECPDVDRPGVAAAMEHVQPLSVDPSVLVDLLEQVAAKELQASLPGIAPVLALLPAVRLVVVPVELVVLALDLEGLDDLRRS